MSKFNLVTGASGIVGSHVVLHLLKNSRAVLAGKQKGSDVSKVKSLFDYYGESALYEKIEWIDIDVRDIFSIEEALNGVTNVFHCAGLVSFSTSDRKKLFEINEKGTRNVVDACIQKQVQALCHVSTIGAINNLDHPNPLTENVFWKRSGRESDYALSKYNAEREVWRGIEEGLNAVIVSPGVILAPGFWDQSSSRIFNNCYKGNRFYTNGLTGYVSATDVARMMVDLVDGCHFTNRYILVENNYHFKTIFDIIHTQFNKPLPSVEAGKLMLQTTRWLEKIKSFFTGKEPLITPALINAALNRQTFSGSKLRDTLKTEFEPVVPVIKNICEYYLKTRPKV